eukprot:gb/GECH01004489.1/.p1 GENE.gb/GECH01004489.1/~~gb/GECH01004489.1/.p1  ORF type:complete len:240 (+),score=37.15 gb/GECH01004489.1/:1-720(+)
MNLKNTTFLSSIVVLCYLISFFSLKVNATTVLDDIESWVSPFMKDPIKSPQLYTQHGSGKQNFSPQSPVWPFQFNTTLAKTNPKNHDIQWTKLFYDYKNQRTKFVFYDYYYDTNGNWGPENFVIYFINSIIYYVWPKTQTCKIRAKDIPTISPWWLQDTVYNGTVNFRGLYSELWVFPEGSGSLTGIQYYNRFATDNKNKIPLRSTNQKNDPGQTDYFDFVEGPQNKELFVVPHYCPKS